MLAQSQTIKIALFLGLFFFAIACNKKPNGRYAQILDLLMYRESLLLIVIETHLLMNGILVMKQLFKQVKLFHTHLHYQVHIR